MKRGGQHNKAVCLKVASKISLISHTSASQRNIGVVAVMSVARLVLCRHSTCFFFEPVVGDGALHQDKVAVGQGSSCGR